MHFENDTLQTIFAMAIFLVVSSTLAIAQKPVKHFEKNDFDAALYKSYETHKDIPDTIRAQALITLSYYPELKDVPIMFRLRKRKTPLTSRPRLLSSLKRKGNRKYVITISHTSRERFTPILLMNLPFNAQIGVLGHELAHIKTYDSMETKELLGLPFALLRKENVDRFEFNTDLLAIKHGLGYQLYEWSNYVRNALDISHWRGASEEYSSSAKPSSVQRYMNPKTILKYMDSTGSYRKIKSCQSPD